jgi:hypothetical protein
MTLQFISREERKASQLVSRAGSRRVRRSTKIKCKGQSNVTSLTNPARIKHPHAPLHPQATHDITIRFFSSLRPQTPASRSRTVQGEEEEKKAKAKDSRPQFG